MNALDKLLAEALASVIREKLGNKTYQKIEARLLERYNLGVADAVKDFQKLDATLREFFGAGADEMEKDFLEHLASLDTPKQAKPWIVIENEELAEQILDSFGDREKRKILKAALGKPDVTLNILERTDIPQSSGYRLIGELIENGFLTESGFATTHDGKKVSMYVSLFDNVRIEVLQGKTSVKVQLRGDVLKESYLARILMEK